LLPRTGEKEGGRGRPPSLHLLGPQPEVQPKMSVLPKFAGQASCGAGVATDPVGFANSGGLVFVDESAEEVAAV
jgi:hypothetical protein